MRVRSTTEKKTDESEEKPRRSISRRRFVETMASLGIVGTIVSFLSLLMSLQPAAEAGQELTEADNIFRYGPEKGTWYSDKAGNEVKPEDFDQVGKGAGVLWRRNIPAVVIRIDEAKLRGTTATNGFIAFASVCTHLCCIATWHLDRPNENVLFCRCHDGVFDPYDVVKDVALNGTEYLGAKVTAGPPPRAVPLIPIEIKDGKVTGVPQNLEIYTYCG
jgi:rieske iron-sulfur protein